MLEAFTLPTITDARTLVGGIVSTQHAKSAVKEEHQNGGNDDSRNAEAAGEGAK